MNGDFSLYPDYIVFWENAITIKRKKVTDLIIDIIYVEMSIWLFYG